MIYIEKPIFSETDNEIFVTIKKQNGRRKKCSDNFCPLFGKRKN